MDLRKGFSDWCQSLDVDKMLGYLNSLKNLEKSIGDVQTNPMKIVVSQFFKNISDSWTNVWYAGAAGGVLTPLSVADVLTELRTNLAELLKFGKTPETDETMIRAFFRSADPIEKHRIWSKFLNHLHSASLGLRYHMPISGKMPVNLAVPNKMLILDDLTPETILGQQKVFTEETDELLKSIKDDPEIIDFLRKFKKYKHLLDGKMP